MPLRTVVGDVGLRKKEFSEASPRIGLPGTEGGPDLSGKRVLETWMEEEGTCYRDRKARTEGGL